MLNPDGTKRCPHCELSLPTTAFYQVTRKFGDGFSGYCISCLKIKAVEWQRQNPEKKAAADAKQRARTLSVETAEKRAVKAAYQRTYRAKNCEKLREKHRHYRAEWAEKNPESKRLDNQLHNNSYRARKKGLMDTFRRTHWNHVVRAFESRCAFCKTDNVILDMEHLIPVVHGGHNVPGNVVPVCRPCNAQKSYRTLEAFCRLRAISDAELAEIRLKAVVPEEYGE